MPPVGSSIKVKNIFGDCVFKMVLEIETNVNAFCRKSVKSSQIEVAMGTGQENHCILQEEEI